MKQEIKLSLIIIPICVVIAAFVYVILFRYIQPFIASSATYLSSVNNLIMVLTIVLSALALMAVFSIIRGAMTRRHEYKVMPIRRRLQYK